MIESDLFDSARDLVFSDNETMYLVGSDKKFIYTIVPGESKEDCAKSNLVETHNFTGYGCANVVFDHSSGHLVSFDKHQVQTKILHTLFYAPYNPKAAAELMSQVRANTLA